MKINVKATGISLTPAISEYIDKKLDTLSKFFTDGREALVNIEVGKTTNRHKQGDIFRAEVHINTSGHDYYAVKETEDLYAAIDEVKDDIVRELTSTRKRAMRLFRKGSLKVKDMIRNFNPWS